MPYLGLRNGEEVIPPQVPDGSGVQCPTCEDEMSVTRSHYRDGSFVSRHFSHKADNTTGGGSGSGEGEGGVCPGESDTHHKMKAIAYARLEEDHPDATVELEGHIDGRFADVLLTFPEPRKPYGKGIAVEAQYRNKGKNIEAVTDHYFEHSYSVAWLEEDDFTTHDVDLSGVLSLWPYALPDRRGASGYSDVIQTLKKETNPTVEVEIPIPGEYWARFDKSGKWITIIEKEVKTRGSVYLSKSPTGDIVLGLSKATPDGGERVVAQVCPDDVPKLQSFADEVDRVAFGNDRPPAKECDSEWHDLAQVWLTGSSTVTSWMKVTLPTPTSTPVLQLWKKKHGETEWVSVQFKSYGTRGLRDIADALELVFEIENGERNDSATSL